MNVAVLPDLATLSSQAAKLFIEVANAALATRGAFTVALSGGSTPRHLYASLASSCRRNEVEWHATQFFWGDERCVPPDDPRSNYRLARELLLDHLTLPASNVHRPRAELLDREKAASEYAEEIAYFVPADVHGVPSFDLMLLGLGSDGHTASLLPGSVLVREERRLVAVTDLEREGTIRLTVTPPVLRHASTLLFLVAGVDKENALRAVLSGPYQPERYPAQVVRDRHGTVHWLIEQTTFSSTLFEGK